MAVLDIRLIGDAILRANCKPVPKVTKRVEKLVADMADTLYASGGVGLSAPQVGVKERIAVVDVGDGLTCLINPVVVQARGEATDVEGCLSIPDVQGYVTRPASIVVEALNAKGRPVRHKADGLFARCIQHEIDHLDGVLIVDKMVESPEAPDEPGAGGAAGKSGGAARSGPDARTAVGARGGRKDD